MRADIWRTGHGHWAKHPGAEQLELTPIEISTPETQPKAWLWEGTVSRTVPPGYMRRAELLCSRVDRLDVDLDAIAAGIALLRPSA